MNYIKSDIPKNVKLVAISKGRNPEDIMKIYKNGIRDFGENKIQELINKIEILPNDIKWHFIGNLQTNKVKYIVGKVELIHSLSSIKLLEKIESEFSKYNLIANVLIQINIGKEETKSGFFEEEINSLIQVIERYKHVSVKGIMAIIPKGDIELNRYYFKKVNKIFNDLKEQEYKNIEMKILSMGMSNDYKVAIEEGSNLIRIGRNIFE